MEVVSREKIGPAGWQLLSITVNPYGGVVWHKRYYTVPIAIAISPLLLSSRIYAASIRRKDICLTIHIPIQATGF